MPKTAINPVLDSSTSIALSEKIRLLSETKLHSIFLDGSLSKLSRDKEISKLRSSVLAALNSSMGGLDTGEYHELYTRVVKDTLRHLAFSQGLRADGRRITEVRPIPCEAGLYEPLHGSAL